jgi:hypothetical protein
MDGKKLNGTKEWWHYTHTKFCETLLIGSKFASGDTGIPDTIGVFCISIESVESRLTQTE